VAAFDLNCNASELDYTLVSVMGNKYPERFGVEGCDQRAVYVLVQTSQYNSQWIRQGTLSQ
ncbi:MAG: hypothetical protein ACI82G_002198, partial [Bradymonadia bacterium]